MEQKNYAVAVIGAGPAGLNAAKKLAQAGAQVVVFNRDIKPGGLAEYGIYHTKYKMKQGLRKQFLRILADERIRYYGNVRVGVDGDFALDDVWAMGFQAILVAAGAQGTKWLGLPGEDLKGVYHAKDLVYHYNRLPPFSQRTYEIGQRVALIGVGNVMVDIAHWVIRELQVAEVTAVARRGPAEVKFTRKELENVAANLDLEALDAEIARVAPRMQAVGQDPEEAKAFILSALPKAKERVSDTRFRFAFLSSPRRMIGDADGRVRGLEVEDTELVPRNGDTKAKGLGTTRVMDVDTVVFCIGDKVEDGFGLPVQWNAFVKNPEPRFPVGGVSYEVFDPEAGKPIEGVFVAGWSREASHGLVGYARKDGEQGAAAVLQYLSTLPELTKPEEVISRAEEAVRRLSHPVVDNTQVVKLAEIEQAEAARRGVEDFKFSSNEEMLAALDAG